jgi:hypothetical protein
LAKSQSNIGRRFNRDWVNDFRPHWGDKKLPAQQGLRHTYIIKEICGFLGAGVQEVNKYVKLVLHGATKQTVLAHVLGLSRKEP